VAQNRRVNPNTFFGELKRRNIYKVAIGYAVVGWLLIQDARERTGFEINFIKVDPNPLRGDLRFETLVRQVAGG
jgi:hypothetical protein